MSFTSFNSFNTLSQVTSTSASSTAFDNDDDFSLSDALFPDCDKYHYVEKLGETVNPVYLVYCSETNQHYAIKLFYWENDQPSSRYYSELRFAQFSHSNIIKISAHKEEQDLFETDIDPIKVSYIVMEYAKNGDFFDALMVRRIPFDETLVRTYFRQLIEGMEALHSKGAAHLDIKPENLLIDNTYRLKITDFDLSYLPEDGRIQNRGTKNYRAPEIVNGTCKDAFAADIYSAGIALFVLKTAGKSTYTEAEIKGSVSLKDSNSSLFWQKKCQVLAEDESFFSEEFKELVEMMTQTNPQNRATMSQIKESKWYNMEVYSQEQVEEFMANKFL